MTKGSLGHDCTFRTRTESRGISSTFGLLLPGRFLFCLSNASGRLRCVVKGVPPQPNSPTDRCFETADRTVTSRVVPRQGLPQDLTHESGKSHDSAARAGSMSKWPPLSDNSMSKTTVKVVVFHCRFAPVSIQFTSITQHSTSQTTPRRGRRGGWFVCVCVVCRPRQTTTTRPHNNRVVAWCVRRAGALLFPALASLPERIRLLLGVCCCSLLGDRWCWLALTSHLCYTPHVVAQYQTRVKLNRVFFPR